MKKYDILFESVSVIPFFVPRLGRDKYVMIHHLVDKYTLHERLGALALVAGFIQNKLTPLVYRNIGILANSKGSKTELEKLGYRMCHLVSLGLDIPKSQVTFSKKENLAICPGPLRPWKRIDHIIKAFSFSDNAWQLAIFGAFLSKDYEKMIRKLVEETGIGHRTTFLGYITQEEKEHLYSASKLCLIASRKEGWGLSAFEPQAYACLPLAYDVQGIRESVLDHETGILVKDGDLATYCKTIREITSNQQLIERLSNNCYSRSKGFSWDDSYANFKAILFNV